MGKPSCNYQGYEFGAGAYPDSVCIGGRLHDADACDDDGSLYAQDENIPCPMCHPFKAVAYWARRNWEGVVDDAQARANARALVVDIRGRRGVRGWARAVTHKGWVKP